MSTGIKLLITVLIVLLCLLQYRIWHGEGSLSAIHRLRQEIAAQKIENAKLKDTNAGLAAEVKALKKGNAAVEELARSRLGMIQKGDTFYQYVAPPANAQSAATPPAGQGGSP